MSEPVETTSGEMTSGPRWYEALVRFRFLLAGVYLLAVVLVVGWLLMVLAASSRENIVPAMIIGLVLFSGQALLLAGAPQLRWPKRTRRRHIAISLFAGALTAAILSSGVFATILSLLDHKFRLPLAGNSISIYSVAIVVAVPWLFWLLAFSLLWARRWTTGFGRMYRVLVAGTCVELLFTIPVDAWVRKRTQCWCDEGTFFALAAGITAAFWTFGPGVALLFLAVRIRRRQRTGHCVRCGYDLRGLPERRCPECGTPFETGAVADAS